MGAHVAGPPSPQSTDASNGGTPPRRRPRAKRWLILAAIIVAAIVAWVYFHYRNQEGTDDAQVEAHVDPIAPRVAGTVTQVDVLENQSVGVGDVLFRLDDRDYRLALAHAQADLDAAEAAATAASGGVPITRTTAGTGLSSADAGLIAARAGEDQAKQQLALAESRRAAARADLAQAGANAERAANDERRYAQLAKRDEVSQQRYDAVSTTAKAAAAQETAARANVAAANNSVAAAAAGVDLAQAKVEQAMAMVRNAASGPQHVAVSRATAARAEAQVALARAAVARAQLNLDWTVVRAPVAGIVGDKHVEVGQSFTPGQPGLDIVESGQPLRDRWVIANFKETQLQDMRPGQKASVHVDAYNEDLRAHVDSVGAATGSRFSLLPPENATGNYVKVVQRVPVKLFFQPGQDKEITPLRPGMSVEVTVYTK